MSSEYMRKIMESIEAANQMNEGYEDRVQAVADWFAKKYPDGLTKKMFTQTLDTRGDQIASEVGATELKSRKAAAIGSRGKTGDSRKDFIKDVAARMDFRRDTSTADAKRERVNQVLERLADMIDEAIGNAFPDGDPWDALYPKMRKMGIREYDMLDWLDRAVKKHLGAKDYHTYLRQSWGDHDQTLSTMPGYDSRPNPW